MSFNVMNVTNFVEYLEKCEGKFDQHDTEFCVGGHINRFLGLDERGSIECIMDFFGVDKEKAEEIFDKFYGGNLQYRIACTDAKEMAKFLRKEFGLSNSEVGSEWKNGEEVWVDNKHNIFHGEKVYVIGEDPDNKFRVYVKVNNGSVVSFEGDSLTRNKDFTLPDGEMVGGNYLTVKKSAKSSKFLVSFRIGAKAVPYTKEGLGELGRKLIEICEDFD